MTRCCCCFCYYLCSSCSQSQCVIRCCDRCSKDRSSSWSVRGFTDVTKVRYGRNYTMMCNSSYNSTNNTLYWCDTPSNTRHYTHIAMSEWLTSFPAFQSGSVASNASSIILIAIPDGKQVKGNDAHYYYKSQSHFHTPLHYTTSNTPFLPISILWHTTLLLKALPQLHLNQKQEGKRNKKRRRRC